MPGAPGLAWANLGGTSFILLGWVFSWEVLMIGADAVERCWLPQFHEELQSAAYRFRIGKNASQVRVNEDKVRTPETVYRNSGLES